jgi:hypothetical protein
LTQPNEATAAVRHPSLTPRLLRHGEHVRSLYVSGAWGRSTDEERLIAGVHGTLARFKKHERASDDARSFGWIKATYPDAIEFCGSKAQLEGMIMVVVGIGLMVGTVGVSLFSFTLFASNSSLFVRLLSLPMLATAVAFTAYMVVMPLRRVWRVPRDLPIIFDRKHRKVYRIVLDAQPGFWGLFKPWPILACEYDWDLIDAEHNAAAYATSAGGSRLQALVFIVRKSADDPTIIDYFEVGKAIAQGEGMIALMYEHIRRFMEEDGPHVDSRDGLDSRSSNDKPTWWQACGRAGPFGSRYGWWWRKHTFMTLAFHVIGLGGIWLTAYTLWYSGLNPVSFLALSGGLVIALSTSWGQGTGIWLLAHTSIDVQWPDAVKQAVGEASARGRGW